MESKAVFFFVAHFRCVGLKRIYLLNLSKGNHFARSRSLVGHRTSSQKVVYGESEVGLRGFTWVFQVRHP